MGPQFPDFASPQLLGEVSCDRERLRQADARNCFEGYSPGSIAGFERREHDARERTRKSAAAVVLPAFESRDASRAVTLEAIAGVRLPETLAITAHFPEQLRRGV